MFAASKGVSETWILEWRRAIDSTSNVEKQTSETMFQGSGWKPRLPRLRIVVAV